MKKGLVLLLVLTATILHGQNMEKYIGAIDLNDVVDDKLQVLLTLPQTSQAEIEYHIPKIVPGTYSISDFGRFITDFKAMDAEGSSLEFERLSDNRWLIKGANQLQQISYWVEDTYDTGKGNAIFEPAGTNIEDGKNFVINTFGFFGYLDGMKNIQYEVNITHPENLYGGTSMIDTNDDPLVDTFKAPNYFDLADAPIMYSEADTTTMMVGGAEILVQVYSPNNVMDSKFVMDNVSEILNAQKDYLGGTLPIKKYAFLIYLLGGPSLSGGFGALEHSYSSMYTFPEVNPILLAQSVRDVAAHEFFHIITPLNIHSEEIGNFDFINPKMSQHLWMYEGVTEYSAGHVQVKHGLMDLENYLNVIEGKIVQSQSFKDNLPFTTMSKLCLVEHEDQYQNVYQKGALIGMALDIKLRKLSGGDYGVQDLMQDLAKYYGKETSFKDDELFDKIVSLTYPEVRDFFNLYVAGPNPLPYRELFSDVGLLFVEAGTTEQLTLGNIGLGLNTETSRLVINNIDGMNAFGVEMGYQQGDEFVSINDEEVSPAGFQQLVENYRANVEAGDKVKVVVMRNVNGRDKKVKLKAKAITISVDLADSIEINLEATPEQLALRKAWVGA